MVNRPMMNVANVTSGAPQVSTGSDIPLSSNLNDILDAKKKDQEKEGSE